MALDSNSRAGRGPNIVKVGSSGIGGSSRRQHLIFCKSCHFAMTYVAAYHAYCCDRCGNISDPDPETDAMVFALEQEQQPTRPVFSNIDGSPIDTSGGGNNNKSHSSGQRSSPGGITRAISKTPEERLRPKSDMQRLFDAQDKQLMRAGGITITSDTIDIQKSDTIWTKEELDINEKGGRRRSFGRRT